MEYETDLLPDNERPSEANEKTQLQGTQKLPIIVEPVDVPSWKEPPAEVGVSTPCGYAYDRVEGAAPVQNEQASPANPGSSYYYGSFCRTDTPYSAPDYKLPYRMPQQPAGYRPNPYGAEYYGQNCPETPYAPGQMPNLGNPRGTVYEGWGYPAAQRAPMPVRKKNRKPVVALICGLFAMGFLNYFPFIALVLGVIAICTAYTGLREGRISGWYKAWSCIGLGLGIFTLIISITMLVMLLTLTLKAIDAGVNGGDFVYR